MTYALPRPMVLATGVFDLLHVEHVRLLQFARAQGCQLIVGINDDQSVQRIKGPGRPIIPVHHRAEMVRALDCVDRVMVFAEDTPARLIQDLKPDVLIKGHDYRDKGVPEAEILKEWGGRLVIAPTSSRISTSQIIERISGAKALADVAENFNTTHPPKATRP